MSSLTRQLPTDCPASARVRGSAKLSFALGTCRDRGNNNHNNDSYPPYHARALASGCGPVRRLSCALAFGTGSVRPPSKGSGLGTQITDHRDY